MKNCAKEPEVLELANYLNSCGAQIQGAGESEIIVNGVESLNATRWNVLFDRIEAGTYLIAGAITNGHVKVNKINPETIDIVSKKLIEMGVKVNIFKNSVEVDATSSDLKAQDIFTEPFPGFPTDMQAQFMTLNTIAQGDCTVEETVFEKRSVSYTHLTLPTINWV